MATSLKRKSKEKPLEELLGEQKAIQTKNGKLVDKRWTGVSTKAATTEEAEQLTPESLRPTDEQLAKINEFTRSPKTADDVVALPIYACNDLPDRDVDQFTTDTVKGFHDLEGQLSPVGKSYMVSHDHRTLPVGRIFDKAIEKKDGITHLKLYSYIPNTDTNKSFIENLDFGVYWAVSVGVMINEQCCKVGGKEHGWMMGWFGSSIFCEQGHEKGLWYDINSEEKDEWGYPLPLQPDEVDEANPNHQFAVRQLKGASDFYELSQVYLGAQYYSELEKGALKGIQKSASKSFLIGINAEEAKALEFPVDDSIRKALMAHKVIHDEDGEISWIDEHQLKWTMENGERMCLGKVAKEEEDEEEEIEKDSTEEPTEDEKETNEEESEEETETTEEEEEVVESSSDEGDEKMPKAVVLAAATKAGISTGLLEKLATEDGNGLEWLLKELSTQNDALSKAVEGQKEMAKLGQEYVKQLKADVIDMYVKANQEQDKSVDVAAVERLLEVCGSDLVLIKELGKTYEKQAQEKFPKAVRRSSFDNDPNKAPLEKSEGDEVDDKARSEHQSRVKRIHG